MLYDILGIWLMEGKKTPFAVRRIGSPKGHYTVVEKIIAFDYPEGKAYGYPCINGEPSNEYASDYCWIEYKLIPRHEYHEWIFEKDAIIPDKK